MRPLLFAVCLGASASFARPPDPSQDAPGLGLAMTRLELALDLDYADGSLSGSARYLLHNASASAITEVPFNVGRLMTVREARGPEDEALAVRQDVAVFDDSPKRQVNHVSVELPHPLAPGAETWVELSYGGYLVGYTETGSIYIKDRIDEDFSILREDAFAWPTLGTLNRRINRVAPRPDFTYRARITVPEGQTVASAGRLVERATLDGRTTFAYESVGAVPFLNLPIAPYERLSRAGVQVYHFPQDAEGAQRLLGSATGGLDLLARWFGPLGSAPEVVVMEIPEVWGSQASLTAGIIQTADAFRDGGGGSALYHELSHLWNAPDNDQPSARWNEGLATFLAQRMARELDGRDGMPAYVQRTADRLVAAAEDAPTLAEVPFIRYGERGMTDRSYSVGLLLFYALYETLGEARFDAALGGYYQDHRTSGGTFEELMSRIQAEAATDLTGFFRTWVHTTDWLSQLRAGTAVRDIGGARP